MSEAWLSIVEYARKFHVSDMTIRRRIKTGRLHAVLREGKYYIPVGHTKIHARNDFEDETPELSPAPEMPKPKEMPVPARPSVSEFSVKRQVINPHVEPVFQQPTRPMPEAPKVSVNPQVPVMNEETKRLVAFCEFAAKRFTDLEKTLEDQYKDRIARFEAELKSKDVELNQMRQQNEDLQLLVKILERRGQSQNKPQSP